MRVLFNISAIFRSEKGVTAVYVALLISVFIGFGALAVDSGFIKLRKSELKKAADAAALAGAGASSATIARDVASSNKITWGSIPNDTDHVEVTTTGTAVTVKVIANGPIPTIFANPKDAKIYWATATADNISGKPKLIP